MIELDPHAITRMQQRGAEENEVKKTVTEGIKIPAKYGRAGFKKNFIYNSEWNNKFYKTKQVIVYAEQEIDKLLVITVITKYF